MIFWNKESTGLYVSNIYIVENKIKLKIKNLLTQRFVTNVGAFFSSKKRVTDAKTSQKLDVSEK